MKLLIATHNEGKVKEYRALLRSLGAELVSLDEIGIPKDVAEDGDTYAENALAKAHGYAEQAGLLTLADDSGLEVDALVPRGYTRPALRALAQAMRTAGNCSWRNCIKCRLRGARLASAAS